MHAGIVVRPYEGRRGCGIRNRAGRMYLCFDGGTRGCGKMPIPLTTCPCCGNGFRYSRAPIWIEQPERLWENLSCASDSCKSCPLSTAYETGPALLMWVGETFYRTAGDFNKEAFSMGISRYIQHVPRRFKLGKTWVLLAHQKSQDIGGVFDTKPHWVSGIFGMFKPQRIEIMVTGDEPDSVIDNYIERGLTPVLINKPKAPENLPVQNSFVD